MHELCPPCTTSCESPPCSTEISSFVQCWGVGSAWSPLAGGGWETPWGVKMLVGTQLPLLTHLRSRRSPQGGVLLPGTYVLRAEAAWERTDAWAKSQGPLMAEGMALTHPVSGELHYLLFLLSLLRCFFPAPTLTSFLWIKSCLPLSWGQDIYYLSLYYRHLL